jgi:8-amino-7-oxononanoate synthase
MTQNQNNATVQFKSNVSTEDLPSFSPSLSKGSVTPLPVFEHTRAFDKHPGYIQMMAIRHYAEEAGIADPFFAVHNGHAKALTQVNGQSLVNYSSYNYLGLNGDPRVGQACLEAIEQYGTSVSASRLVSGERAIHQELEQALAEANDCESALTFVSGHATNVTILGYLYNADDLIVHDKLAHNSILQGIRLSGADRLGFKHNDFDDLQQKLSKVRHKYRNVLIIVEGLYSMDGDVPDLPTLVDIKRQWGCHLMVDDAHGLGVLGKTGLGIREHFGLRGDDIDILTGTLSKTLASAGGYVAGSSVLIDTLRFWSPGFLYSVGLPPPATAAALAALRILQAEPERVQRLQHISQYFLNQASELDMNTGTCQGFAIVPAIIGDPRLAVLASQSFEKHGVHVKPIIYPAVSDQSARLRFFISCDHTEAMVDQTLEAWSEVLAELPDYDGVR